MGCPESRAHLSSHFRTDDLANPPPCKLWPWFVLQVNGLDDNSSDWLLATLGTSGKQDGSVKVKSNQNAQSRRVAMRERQLKGIPNATRSFLPLSVAIV